MQHCSLWNVWEYYKFKKKLILYVTIYIINKHYLCKHKAAELINIFSLFFNYRSRFSYNFANPIFFAFFWTLMFVPKITCLFNYLLSTLNNLPFIYPQKCCTSFSIAWKWSWISHLRWHPSIGHSIGHTSFSHLWTEWLSSQGIFNE